MATTMPRKGMPRCSRRAPLSGEARQVGDRDVPLLGDAPAISRVTPASSPLPYSPWRKSGRHVEP